MKKWRGVRKKCNWRGGKRVDLVKTHYTHVGKSQVIKKKNHSLGQKKINQ